MLKRSLILIALAIMATPAMAQTSFYTDRALQQVNVLTSPTPLTAAIPYGPVRVCSLPLTQQSPCLPLATITDVNGNAISNSIGPLFGQLTSDATGRFTFGCTNNVTYQVQVTQAASNTPAVNYPITCPGGVGASVSANNTFIGNNIFNGTTALNSTLIQTTAGAFTNGTNTASSQNFVGGFTQAMANSIQGTSFLTDTEEVGLLIPSTSTIFQANSFNTFLINKSSTTAAVGYYAQVAAKANNTRDWAMNPVIADFDENGTAYTGSALTGLEVDMNTKSSTTTGIGVQMIEDGPAAPTANMNAYSLVAINGGAWNNGFIVQNGAVPAGNAIQIGSEGATGVANKASGNVSLFGYNSGGVASGLNFNSSKDGDFILNTAASRGFAFNLGGTIPTAPTEPRGIAEWNIVGTAPTALNANLANGFNLTDGGNAGCSFGFTDATLNGWIQCRNTVGANNTAYPLLLNQLGGGFGTTETAAPTNAAGNDLCYGDSTLHALKCSYNNGTFFQIPQVITATSAAFATATTAGTCVQNTTAVTNAATTMAVSVSPVSTPGVGAVWSAFVSSAGNVTINECAVATSAGGSIAFNIRVTP